MKKRLALATSAILLSFGLTACDQLNGTIGSISCLMTPHFCNGPAADSSDD